MNLPRAIRWTLSYAAFLGGGVCLWQAHAFWERQSQSMGSRADAWMELLRPHLVVVDAGHGGTDGGTQGFGILEKKCSLEIAGKVDKHLRAMGMRTVMTRSDDSYVELAERSAIANRSAASLFVSIHLNADGTSGETAGVETYYCARKRLGDLARLREKFHLMPGRVFKDERSEWLAQTVQRSVCAATGAVDRRARDSNYLVVMHSECPSVLVECGYLSNETESSKLSTARYQEKIATAIAGSVRHFLLATSLNPKRGIVMDPLIDALATGSTRDGNP